jgi:hypothetical protein
MDAKNYFRPKKRLKEFKNVEILIKIIIINNVIFKIFK